MSFRRVENAEFNRVYQQPLTAINSGLALEFDKPNQFKKINQITLCAVDAVTGGFKSGANDLFVKYMIIKGKLVTALSTSPPIPNPFPATAGNEIDGNYIEYAFKNTSLGDDPHITFNPPLLFDPDQEITVYINNGYESSAGAQTDVIITVTVLGEYVPRRNAALTKEQYLNPVIQ